ncbi:hypothetical protein DCS_04414 [Drechmeria coniospora]|uniref:Uncharacterized protein n=1 Tax=Drechmeria coniospora TaxID=98403 RepID=A0A151GJW8_DRECN|nr:hypothetical protein DCS_04414 [Drechmeria coniospora]KYK57405.1 hypothetical protein DCS_04414 [Drechmeria coniospora]
MKLIAALAVTLATLAVATPTPDENPFDIDPRDNILVARKSCSANRLKSDRCSGKKLRKQNSWHNCKDKGGKCCAKNANGSGGRNVKDGIGREDCGYCFSGQCKG